MVKVYHHTKNEVSMLRHSEVIARTDTHTDSMKHYLPTFAGGKYSQNILCMMRSQDTVSYYPSLKGRSDSASRGVGDWDILRSNSEGG